MKETAVPRTTWKSLNRRIEACHACARLRDHCADIARVKRRAYANEEYWGKPVGNFGDPEARLLVVGLAPGAHGANRTGRMFTGDRSGDWLYRALHRAGFANQPHSTDRNDGLELIDCAISNICHCAPPDNKPTNIELSNCRAWLQHTTELLPIKVFVALGGLAWKSTLNLAFENGWLVQGKSKFAHGVEAPLSENRFVIGCYHPSQQNTFTGRLTEKMLDDIFRRAIEMLSGVVPPPPQW